MHRDSSKHKNIEFVISYQIGRACSIELERKCYVETRGTLKRGTEYKKIDYCGGCTIQQGGKGDEKIVWQ